MNNNPETGQIWRHSKGTVYDIIGIANQGSVDRIEQVVYRDHNGERIWTKPLDIWHEKMERSQ